jgi:hypothetical protein
MEVFFSTRAYSCYILKLQENFIDSMRNKPFQDIGKQGLYDKNFKLHISCNTLCYHFV